MHNINKYSPEELMERYNKILNIITTTFEGERQERLLHLYSDKEMGELLVTAPASGTAWFHYCYVGGYMDHIINICSRILAVAALYKKMGGHIDFTKEEAIFAALNHDLGKLGQDRDTPYYIPSKDSWRIEKRQEYFEHNNTLSRLSVPDRSLFVLQNYGVTCNLKETLAIKNHDGMYNENNKMFFIANLPEHKAQTNLPYILHWADHMSSQAEYDEWKYDEK